MNLFTTTKEQYIRANKFNQMKYVSLSNRSDCLSNIELPVHMSNIAKDSISCVSVRYARTWAQRVRGKLSLSCAMIASAQLCSLSLSKLATTSLARPQLLYAPGAELELRLEFGAMSFLYVSTMYVLI